MRLTHLVAPIKPALRPAIRRVRRLRQPARFGSLRRTTPLSSSFGFRGTAVDRFYIDGFLENHGTDIHGYVLEVENDAYTRRFGSDIRQRDVLDIDEMNTAATIIADLATADAIPSNTYDCFILTQTLQYIYDTRAAISHVHRILRPGGVVLATVPSTTRIDPRFSSIDCWRFTPHSCTLLFGGVFGSQNVEVQSHGNVLVSIAKLSGIAYEELSQEELAVNDPYFPVVTTVRAVKR